jgi:DNA-binding CsgD family transcriptional regulator
MWRLQGVFLEANAASALVDLGRWREARDLLTNDTQRTYAGVGRLNRAVVAGPLAVRQGRLEDGRELLNSVHETIAALGDAQFSGPLYTGLIELARQERRLDDARRLVDEAMDRMADTEDVRLRAEVLAAGVGVEADRAIEERARRNADGEQEAIHLARSRLALIRLLLPAGKRGEAWVGVLARGFEAFAEAEFSRALGQNEPAAWRRALERWQAIGYPYPMALARHRLAESILTARGSRAEAAEQLAAARSATAALDAEPLVGAIDQLARFARLDLPRAGLAGPEPAIAKASSPSGRAAAPFGLTARELEVLEQLVGGRSNRQIGAALFISESTVGVHVSNILGKLGVTSRVEAAAIAARSGIGHPETSEPTPV